MRNKKLNLWLICLYLFITPIFAVENISSGYSATDVLAFKRVVQVMTSPDGKQVAFTIFKIKSDASSGKKWEYLLYIRDQHKKISLLSQADKISWVSWSADGNQIAYLAKGKKSQSILDINLQTHQTNKLLELNRDIASYKWSPDGKYIAFVAEDDKSTNSKVLTPKDVDKDYVNNRLYLLTLNNKKIEPLTSANINIPQYYSAPCYDWDPNSQFIVFAYRSRPEAEYNFDNKLAIIDIKTHAIKTIPYTETHNSIQPLYSLNGKWIAFQSNSSTGALAAEVKNSVSDKPSRLLAETILTTHICVADTTSFATHCLSETPNENPLIIGWNQNSEQIFVLDYFKTQGTKIYALNLNSTIPTKLISNINGFIEPLTITLNNSGNILGFGYETVNNAPEAMISATDLFKLEQVSHLQTNPEKNLGNVKTIHWQSSDGMQIEGLLFTPPNYEPKKKYPLLVSVHGGPAGEWSQRYLGGCEEYEIMFEPAACYANLLNLGFIILQPNPRGSDGYGSKFRLANFADLGGGDYHDIMSGVDSLIQQGIADPNRLAISGWSFGGYMTAWAISQTPRFKAAIDGDGNTDFISFSGTSELPHYYPEFLGTTFWNNNHLYLERAPIMYTKNITTPLLILQGEEDPIVPLSQAYELYTALRIQHKPVKMLIFPEQSHLPMDANIIFESIEEIDDWWKQMLATNSAQ